MHNTVTNPWPAVLLLPLMFLLGAASATTTCQSVASSPPATLCAPPWSPAGAPTPLTPVSISVTFGATPASVVAAAVNGAASPFVEVGAGNYSLTHATQALGTDWPWAGLHVNLTLSTGGTVAGSLVVGSTWEDALVLGDPNAAARGVCVADVDNDGDADVFVATTTGAASQLWVNDGAGGFSNQAAAWGLATPADSFSHGCGFADADGDGRLDLAVTNWKDDVHWLFMNTEGEFVEQGSPRGVRAGNTSLGLCWGDVDGDGDVDLYVASSSASKYLFINNGTAVFTDEASPRGARVPSSASRQPVFLDIDNDADLDLLVVGADVDALLVNDGRGHFEEDAAARGLTDGGNSFGVAAADWNGDGAVDFLVARNNDVDLLYVNNGAGFFTEGGVGAGLAASTGRGRAPVALDAELDGDLDFVVGVREPQDQVWASDGGAAFVDASPVLQSGSVVETFALSAGDVDGDGDVDVLRPNSGSVLTNTNARPGLHPWLVVRPLTTAGAQSAFGAAVRLHCLLCCGGNAGWTSLRVIDGGSGLYSQNAYDAHFGVPAPAASYNASVRWAGDAHPPANWTTHYRLGGVVPGGQTLVVRAAPVEVAMSVLPWNSSRGSSPAEGDAHTITLRVSPELHAGDVAVVSGVVNGQHVTASWVDVSGGVLALEYVTEAGQESWPWGGVEAFVVVEDSGGLASAASLAAVPGSSWVEESDDRGMAWLANGAGRGVCMGDVDNDGDVDVFAAVRSGTTSQLWMNSGSGGFTNEAASWGVAGSSTDQSIGCVFADVDGDGLLDLFVTQWVDGVNRLHVNLGGAFAEEAASRGVQAIGATCTGAAAGDVDGDGDLDLYASNAATAPNLLFINDGAGTFTEAAGSRGVQVAAVSSGQAALADLDGDGDLDMVVANVGTDTLHVNTGPGLFVEDGADRGFSNPQSSEALAVGDWSGDGAVDVYVSSWNGNDLLYVNDGSGSFAEVGAMAGIAADVNSFGVTMLDLEFDGDVDIVVGSTDGVDLTWMNDGGGRFQDGTGALGFGSPIFTYGVAAGDLDGDGDLDVVFSRRGDVFMNPNAHPDARRVVVVRPLTAAGAQSALGAAVRLLCVAQCGGHAGWAGLRVIDGGGGLFSQNAYDAHFGVPAPAASYNASVRWAGDAHPPANWTTHHRLGGITPAALRAPSERTFVVRPAPPALALGAPQPWSFHGGNSEPPPPGTQVLVPIFTPATAMDLQVTAATVNGQNVRTTFAGDGPGLYTLLYTTVAGQRDWPWDGLQVEVATVDSGGLVSSLSATVVPGAVFEDVTTVSALSTMAATAQGLCVGDVDGDGSSDVVVAVAGGGNQLFSNAGNGVFSQVPSPGFQGGGGDITVACALGDADGDGALDVFFSLEGDRPHQLYVQDAGGQFANEAAPRGMAAMGTGRGVAWGDVNADGALDLYVCVLDAQNVLFMNNGSGFFADEAGVRSVAATSDSVQAAMFDVDNDADVDIVVVSFASDGELFVNDGSGGFTSRAAFTGFLQPGAAAGVATGDADGNGWLDVFVVRWDAADQLFLNSGGSFVDASRGRGFLSPGSSSGVAMFDAVHDGNVDILVANSTTGLWVNTGDSFVERGDGFGFAAGVGGWGMAAVDVDGDGDLDVVGHGRQYRSHASSGGQPHWVVVRPLTAAGGASAFGATVTLTCVTGCEGTPWAAVRSVDGGSGRFGQGAYGAHFGLPVGGTMFDAEVVFVGGATHGKHTDGRLGGVAPGTVIDVIDRPYLEGVGAVYGGGRGGYLGINDTVVVVLRAGRGRQDLVPGPGCCFVNGVQVADSFVGGGDGSYNLTYVVQEGDPAWDAGNLVVVPTLQSSGRNLSMVEVVYGLEGSVGDPVAPVVVLECGPAAASANVWEEVCVACPWEASCVFSFVVESTSLPRTEGVVPAANYTGSASAIFFVGPFNDSDAAALTVFAVDAAGNRNQSTAVEWRVDTSSPVTTLVDTPAAVTQRSGATFTLQCSEASCSFSYVLDDGPLTALGGNGTAAGDVTVMETSLVAAPGRVSNVTAPVVVFGVNASDVGMLVNSTVDARLGGGHWALGVTGNVTEVLQLPPLPDGTYELTGVGESGDGVVDISPVQYVFTVDTQPPSVGLLQAPADGDEAERPTFVVGASEADCVFWWRGGAAPLNASWQEAGVGVARPVVVSGGRQEFEVFAVDAAGNVGEVLSHSWTPAGCPHTVPDVVVTSNVGVGVGHRHVTVSGASGEAQAFEYRVDGGAWVQPWGRTALLEGVALGTEHVMEVRAAAPAVCNGRLETSRPPAQVVTWVEPAPLPLEAQVIGAPDALTPDVFAEFLLAPSRALAWLECSLDGEAWAPCGSRVVVGPLQAGEHTMRVRAVDAGGEGSGGIQAHTWTITAASESSIVLSGLPDGVHTLTVVATDGAGSVEVAPKTFEWRVDTTPPTLAGNRSSPAFSTSRVAVVDVVCLGEVDPCTFCWTSPTVPANCSTVSPVLLQAPADGAHTADVRAVDSVGLASEAVVEVAWTVDSTPPVVNVTDSNGVFIAPVFDTTQVDAVLALQDVQLTLAANEALAGYVVALGGAPWPPGAGGLVEGPTLSFTGLPPIINEVVVTGIDLSGNAGVPVELSILVDVAAPDDTVFTPGLPVRTKASALEVPVGCVDVPGGSGVRHIVVFVDGVEAGAVVGGGGALVVDHLVTGTYNVSAAGVDVAGNVDPTPVWQTVDVDQVPPVSLFADPPPALVASPSLAVRLAANEPAALFGRVVNHTDWLAANASGVVVITGLPDGWHAVEARAVDVAGNEEREPHVVSGLVVDTTPPATSAVLAGDVVAQPGVDGATRAAAIAVNVSASEATLGFRVWVDGVLVEGLAPGPGVAVANLEDGIRNVSIAGVDLAGNVDAVPAFLVVWVDTTPPPRSQVVSLPPSPTRETTVSVAVAGTDADGGVGLAHLVVSVLRVGDGVLLREVVVAGGAGEAVLEGVTTGMYNVTVVGVDAVGNVGPVPGWGVMEVDHIPPVSSFARPPPPFHAASRLSVWVAANEAGAVFGRAVNASGWLPANASGAVTFEGLPDGRHVVETRAVDAAGNEEALPYGAAEFVVDTVAPVLYWVSPPPAFTSNRSALGCFAANDSSHVTFSVDPGTLSSPSCVVVEVAADGLAGVTVTGTDAAGNVGEVLGGDWVLDRVPPLAVVATSVSASAGCVHVVGGATVCNAVDAATMAVTCEDGGAGVEVSPCRAQFAVALLEAAAGSGCAVASGGGRRLLGVGFEDAPGGVFALEGGGGDGRYGVAVRGVDAAGNVQDGNVTEEWHVDTVDPVRPVFVQSPDEVVSTTTVLFLMRLEGDTSPGQSVFWYKRDDGVGSAVDDLPGGADDDVQLELSGLESGDHKVEVWAVDQGGNVGPSVLHNWQVIADAPGVVILEQPAAVSGDVTPSFVFAARWVDRPAGNASEPSAGIEVSLGGGEFVVVCADTVGSGGVCVWNASLAETGVGAYTVNVRASIAGNVGNPTPFAWQYTLCGDDQFAEVGADGGILCVGCPVGGNCAGGLTSQSEIAAVRGFWAPPGSNGLRFYDCPVEEACLPGGEVVVGNETVRVVGQCAEGYMGTLCGVCEDGFFEQFGLCVSCGTDSGVAWLIMFAVLVGVIGVGVLFFKFRELMPIDQLKVTLSMVQIVASANTAYDIPWPPLFADFLNTMRVFLIEAVSLTRANCAQPMTFYGSLVVTLVGFKVVLAMVVFGPVVLHKCRHRRRAAVQNRLEAGGGGGARRRRSSIMQSVVLVVQAVNWAKIFKITFLFLFVAYPGVSLKIMTIFKCVEVEGESWLVADMRLKCYEGDWYGYALYAFVMGCLYTAGLPLAITVILWRNRRKLGEAGVVGKWGFLYESYGVGAYLWEVVELLRKLWLSALVVLMEEGSPLQVTVAVLISGWAHVLHAVYKPWRGVGEGGTKVYALQHGSLMVTFFVFLMGLLFKMEGVSQDGGAYNFLAWAMLVACAGFLMGAAAVLVAAGMVQVRVLRGKEVVGTPTAGGGSEPVTGTDVSCRAAPTPRAVRASHMSAGRNMAWVGNPLRAGGGEKGSV